MSIYNQEKQTHKHKTRESYIVDIKSVHHNKYDYTLIPENVKRKDKVSIICPDHGIFVQQLHNHILGRGCRKCANIFHNEKITKPVEEFIMNVTNIHGSRYGYAKVEYKNRSTKIIIECKEHGDFLQTPAHHLRGNNCPKCATEEQSKIRIEKAKLEFASRSNVVHNNKYSYELVDYKHSQQYVTITCPDHGAFVQIPNAHLRGQGCPKCTSNGFRIDKPAYLYVLLISNVLGDFVGYGITDDTTRRMKEHHVELNKYGYSIVESFYSKEMLGIEAKNIEKDIMAAYPSTSLSIDGFKTENTNMMFFREIKNILANKGIQNI